MHTLQQIQSLVSSAIADMNWQQQPEGLYAPIDYELRLGGKRLRPCLALMAADMYDASLEHVMPVAKALEVFHNFTLLHDDVMDHADVRRGMPTVHRRWNENTAILSGDAMSICAYRELAQLPAEHLPGMLDLFNTMALQICEGQQYDMEFEVRKDVTVDDYMHMIRLKTAVLLATALRMGAVLGGASRHDADQLYDFGIGMGVAFQLKDDYLDVYGNEATFGKAIGGDILCNKKTFMLLTAQQRADEASAAELARWLDTTERSVQKIEAVTALYNRLDVPQVCLQAMDTYYRRALACLEDVSVSSERKSVLATLAAKLMERQH